MLGGMRAYSVDLRHRVLAAVDRGMPRAQVVATFGVSSATIKRWLALRRITPELAPKRPSGRPPTIRPEHEAALRQQLDAQPDATLELHARRWNATHGMRISQWTIGRAIRHLGWTRKKRRWVPANGMSPPASPTASAFSNGTPTHL